MKLTFNDIRKITFGAVSVTETESGIRFARCTKKQIDAWYSESEVLGIRAEATTGIRLDFVTDSPFFEFSATGGDLFEIHVDGLFRKSVFIKEYAENAGIVRFDICDPLGDSYSKGEMHRITLFFPCHDAGALGHVALEDGARFEPYHHSMKMLFIGDSITQGWDSGYPSMGFAPRIDTFFDAESINQGIGGSYFNANAFDVLDFAPDVTVVAYGTNDWGKRKTTDELTSHAKAHLSLVKNAFGKDGRKIFVVSPIWRGNSQPMSMGSFGDCRSAIIKAIDSLELTHIDGLSLVPPYPELYADKYLHPNALGFSFYAENLIKQMQKYL